MFSPWIWKGIYATLQSGRYTPSYSKGRCRFIYNIYLQHHNPVLIFYWYLSVITEYIYFSGMFGSGLCMFSKFPILETFQRNYSLNGYAHRIVHGDWFCGKGVGLAKIIVNDLRINIYVTHVSTAISSFEYHFLSVIYWYYYFACEHSQYLINLAQDN